MNPGCTSVINSVTTNRTKGIVHKEKLKSSFRSCDKHFIKNHIENVKGRKGKYGWDQVNIVDEAEFS